ncbi:Putative uncharacterized protein [Moritella viscosa]|uniref:Uncharacterized protein n=1 Tax=Moritella viscosa TaxID=80854 RepID=A0A1K9Z6I0_9GAMM|nr:Putative uncharacterized protein [Moritella viscosa]SGY89499.1 Putative uncharacterized protein [Moritella viscosa]SGY91788.1 Putative uncharacterized protein [Moritella viscosa]SHO01954.1 Putative uncharacterized protein [Moritella viscosa]SHO02140.1 Putative uncharacterized protein [Moritella viscosa]
MIASQFHMIKHLNFKFYRLVDGRIAYITINKCVLRIKIKLGHE